MTHVQATLSAGVARSAMQEIEGSLVYHTIAIYFRNHQRRIRMTILRRPDWPGVSLIDHLVWQAGGLFVWAATAARFIRNGSTCANGQLHDILQGKLYIRPAAEPRPHLPRSARQGGWW